MQQPQLAETEHHRKRQAGVANARVLGAPAVAPGAEAARSLDTCPTPSWGRAAGQNPVAAAAGDPEPSGMEMGVAEGVRKEARRAGGLGGEGRGARLGYARAERGRASAGVALWEGSWERMAAGVVGPRVAPRVTGSEGTACRLPGQQQNTGVAGGGAKWPEPRGAPAPLDTLCA
ncbi:uncharacterized protein LOC125131431 [Phacochoerus africanus]|uniref:uncharacterized protein LOC125131431 n=1 Tax=Phacochoerus africanus TaxID=41426 RepID=UPI001FD8FAAF|nr:uncharacterized protein LOC125131431 [Phacochoerus africanus]